MRVSVQKVGDGIHPNETVVAVETRDGPEKLVVHKRSIEASSLDIGFPIDERDDEYLVELPRETTSGFWRVWVPKGSVFNKVAAA